jgi:Cu/Ag efflux protein CusF
MKSVLSCSSDREIGPGLPLGSSPAPPRRTRIFRRLADGFGPSKPVVSAAAQGSKRAEIDQRPKNRGCVTLSSLAAKFVVATATAVLAASTVAHVHGRIVSIDARRGTFWIHHDPFPAMPMAMTMEVEPKRRADLRKLHVGETIDATIDTSVVPWLATGIHPAAAAPRAKLHG